VSADWGTVSGGVHDTASGLSATVAGGANNTASGEGATIGGGVVNAASGTRSTAAGGFLNTASGEDATVAGGQQNTASGLLAAVAGGYQNTASGRYSTVAGGIGSAASGSFSFAAGAYANAQHDGAFVWSGNTFTPFSSSAGNEFSARATGGVRFVTNSDGGAGVSLAPGSSTWSSISDRNSKDNFDQVDTRELVKKLAAMPILTWNYKAQARSIRHIGPMAQDFAAAFEVGEDDKHITTIDADGVALAAIQGLYKMVKERDAKLASQERRIADLENRSRQISLLRDRLEVLERQLAARRPQTAGLSR
jgi:hypothetical protein